MRDRITALLLCLALIAPWPCISRAETGDGLLNRAMALCALMDQCAADPQYVKLYGLDGAAQAEIRSMGSHGWDQLRQADMYVLKDGFFEAYLKASSVQCGALPEAVLQKLKEGIPASLPNMVNSGASQAFSAASSALRCGTAFPVQGENMPSYCLLHLTFLSGAEALCSFVRTEGGAVSAYVSAVQKGGLQKALRQMKLSGIPEAMLFDASVIWTR